MMKKLNWLFGQKSENKVFSSCVCVYVCVWWGQFDLFSLIWPNTDSSDLSQILLVPFNCHHHLPHPFSSVRRRPLFKFSSNYSTNWNKPLRFPNWAVAHRWPPPRAVARHRCLLTLRMNEDHPVLGRRSFSFRNKVLLKVKKCEQTASN